MYHGRRAVAVAMVMALAVSACAGGEISEDTLPAGTAPQPDLVQTGSQALVAFDGCDAFLDHVISNAVDLVGPYGLDGFPMIWVEDMVAAEATDAGGDEGGRADFSETNIQVEGVDEPDLVKTDGERIVVLSEGTLVVVDVTGDEPVETGRLEVGDFGIQSLFLSGDTALLFGSVWGGHHPTPLAGRDAIAPGGTPAVQIVEVDLTGDPELIRTMTIDGSFVSGRMVGESVRLVLTSGPVGFEWAQPKGSGLRAERDATEANREIVRNSTEDNWIPYYMVADADGRIVDEGTLFDCDRASHPSEFSGVDMLSVLTVDIGDGLQVSDSMGVLARGDTVYASEDNLYVATQDWDSWRWMDTGIEADRPDGPVTEIHKFDISDPSRTEYLASGSVDGYLLNQFAMDEHDAILRVASTTAPGWWGNGGDSESRITMLREIGDGLVRVGMIDGLGETEQIYSVRFMGDVAYVVTFRQTDPLYTVDLSDPRSPRLLGELKIPGYSAYLHPVADGRLLGIGQDATDEGMVQGSQVSLFDVSDLANPVRLDTHTLSEGTSSQVEYDHHAFLYWEGLAMLPVQQWNWDGETEEVFVGAVGVAVEGDDLVEIARVTHPGGDGKDSDWRAQIMRSIAIGDSLYTVSPKGILKSALDTLDEEAWLGF
jgi:uncharacterized secreted protein with C-terminal beta-propeller domain